MGWIGEVGGVLVGLVLAFAYGIVKKKLGVAQANNEKDTRQNEREQKAKEIESEPAPSKPGSVAKLWKRLH